MKLSTINKRRLDNFRKNKRGYYSFIIIFSLYFFSFGAEFFFNDKPLLVRFGEKTYYPVFFEYSEKTFGGDFDTEADYTDPYVKELIREKGWILPTLFPYDYDTVITDLNTPAPSPPSKKNWLGTDDQSRDVLTRVVYGFRLSMTFGLILTVISLVIGIFAGSIQGYFGGWIDLSVQRLLEIWESLPGLYILIILSALITPSFFWLLLIMSLTSWVGYVGVVRAEFLRIRNMLYVRSAQALGLPNRIIMFRHVLPNALIATITFLPFNISSAITALAALDFLGFGLPPPTPSLGELVYQGKNNLQAPWLAFSAFFTISLMLLLLIFASEALRDGLDHRKTFSSDNEKKGKGEKGKGHLHNK